ncbi:hypothetical protein [Streptomyces sp. NPDC000851]
MKWLLLGALLGLLLVFPSLLAFVAAVVAALLSHLTCTTSTPLVTAFALGLAAGVRMRSPRRWVR